MFTMFLFLLLFFVTHAPIRVDSECQYYTLTSTRTNYSTFTEIYAATNGLNTPIHVCNGAVIYHNESIALIANDTTIIGDVAPNGIYAVWTILTPQSPVFVAAGLITMSVQNINIFFTETLFYVDIHATLVLENTLTWDGNITVLVSGSQGYGMGLSATNAYFAYVAVGIRYVQGSVSCTNCIFVANRLAGILSPDNTLSGFTLTQPVFVNTIYPMAVLVGPDLTYTYLQLISPSNEFLLSNRMIVCRDYPSYQAPIIYNCSTIPVGGSSNNGCDCEYSEQNTIIAAVALGIAIAIFVGVLIWAIYASTRSYSTQDG
jgi:hypothetical protein